MPTLRCIRRSEQGSGERRLMLLPGLSTAVAVVVLDQLGKAAVRGYFAGQAASEHENVTSFFNIVLIYNRGMSFGLFNAGGGLNPLLFSLAAIAIVTVLTYWLSRVESPLLAVAIGLIIGGAIGNVIDRIRFGAVVDFLDFHVGSWHWPAFNVADSAICVGVAVMLLDSLLMRREAH
jgi:signal peptidase II